MAITSDDLMVLTIAMVQKHGYMNTMQIDGKFLERARDLIIAGDGSVRLALTADPQGEYVNVTCLFGKKQMDEGERMGMGRKDIGEA